jgi:hypothetical protein
VAHEEQDAPLRRCQHVRVRRSSSRSRRAHCPESSQPASDLPYPRRRKRREPARLGWLDNSSPA